MFSTAFIDQSGPVDSLLIVGGFDQSGGSPWASIPGGLYFQTPGCTGTAFALINTSGWQNLTSVLIKSGNTGYYVPTIGLVTGFLSHQTWNYWENGQAPVCTDFAVYTNGVMAAPLSTMDLTPGNSQLGIPPYSLAFDSLTPVPPQ
jgi:hypothetical protein